MDGNNSGEGTNKTVCGHLGAIRIGFVLWILWGTGDTLFRYLLSTLDVLWRGRRQRHDDRMKPVLYKTGTGKVRVQAQTYRRLCGINLARGLGFRKLGEFP